MKMYIYLHVPEVLCRLNTIEHVFQACAGILQHLYITAGRQAGKQSKEERAATSVQTHPNLDVL